MATKYQVFVSSTYEDLKSEREVVIKAILEMGHIPVGMEMFSAADEEQWKIIARHIEQSDYYCVIVAHRYGSTTSGVSYTQKEYEYAISVGVPVLGFIIDDEVSWPPEMVDKGEDAARVEEFKGLVRSKPVGFWKSAEDLYGKVSIALTKQMTANPRAGWVRATALAGPEVTTELSRLSAENASLRGELAALQRKAADDRTAEVRAAVDELQSRSTRLSYKYSQSDKVWTTTEQTFASLFFWMAPSLASEVSTERAAGSLAMEIRKDHSKSWWTVAVNQMRGLFADLMALDLVEPSKRKHGVSDANDYWTLTPFGHEVHKLMRVMTMRGAEPEPPQDEEMGYVTDPSDVASEQTPIPSPSAKRTRGKAGVKKGAAKAPAKKGGRSPSGS